MNALQYISDTTYNVAVGLPLGIVDSTLCVGGTAVGVVASALSILNLGTSRMINDVADSTYDSVLILPSLYIPVLKVVNPDAYSSCNSACGIVSANLARPIAAFAHKSACKSNFLDRHVISRVGYALYAVASVISRVADLAIGLVAATFAIIPCLGRIESVNNVALEHLTAFGIVSDICKSFRGMINPQQFVRTWNKQQQYV